MRHLILKFNYGVEIGARLAYLGHYKATKDPRVLEIANEELQHRNEIERILSLYDEEPSIFFNIAFMIVGSTIYGLCQISPKILLDFVAMSMEIFAVFSYKKLAQSYPQHSNEFISMADAENRHKTYFSGKNTYEKSAV